VYMENVGYVGVFLYSYLLVEYLEIVQQVIHHLKLTINGLRSMEVEDEFNL
jgi:hypothetical protein